MNKSSEQDRKVVEYVHGLYVGQLHKNELESFERCIADRVAQRDYSNPGGILGLAKVKYIQECNNG